MQDRVISLSRFRNARNTEADGICVVPFSNSEGEACAIRTALQGFALQHELRFFGHKQGVMAMLAGEDPPFGRYLVLSCHGNRDCNILLWDDEALTPEELQGKIKLPGKVIIATGCSVGRPELAKPFLDGGAEAYIGPTSDPEGGTGFLFVTLFLHAVFLGRRSIHEACEKANQWDNETGMYRVWTAT